MKTKIIDFFKYLGTSIWDDFTCCTLAVVIMMRIVLLQMLVFGIAEIVYNNVGFGIVECIIPITYLGYLLFKNIIDSIDSVRRDEQRILEAKKN